MALNIYAHNEDIEPLRKYLAKIRDFKIDAFIVADPGVMTLLREIIPEAEITFPPRAKYDKLHDRALLAQHGVKRLVLARELTLEEIKTIRENIPRRNGDRDFCPRSHVHIYSGRCLLSNFMINRDANRGMCAHPCRWKYSLVEEQSRENIIR